MTNHQLFTNCLWCDNQAEEAAKFYTSIFPQSGIDRYLSSIHLSLTLHCQNQEEIDHYWEQLTAGGGQESECGWLKDKFGVSWQVEPVQLIRMLKSPDKEKTERVTKAFLQMQKSDLKKARVSEVDPAAVTPVGTNQTDSCR